MTRKSVIQTGVLLVSFCGTMLAIPHVIETLQDAPTNLARSPLGAKTSANANSEKPTPQTLSQWLAERGNEEDLRIIGLADPNLSVEERIVLLEEAKANQPKIATTPEEKAP